MAQSGIFKIGFFTLSLAFAFLRPGTAAGPEPDAATVSKGHDAASKLINAWFAEGKAAGLDGVSYDNRDRKHSDLPITAFPQLSPITYTEDELKRRADWGGQRTTFPGKVIIGNSSTASPASQAGSHQRMYYIHPGGLDFLYQQYRTNALYIYPEHRDHDPGTNGPDGYGDLYPANSPYLISSQGSSGSDRVFMHAFLKTIAAFPPETRRVLIEKGLLMPTLQAIFRHTYKAAPEPADYFTGKSHPSAFEGNLIDELAMVNLAHAMTPEAIPPLVILRVTGEADLKPGRDYFEPTGFTAGERLSDSPCAVARIIRGPAFRKNIRISSAGSADLKNRKLSFRWIVLRGNPDMVKIKPVGKGDAEVEISVAYHPRRPIAPGSSMWSNRVDVGVFAEAEGSLVSAPAFVSFTTLPNEHRTYSKEGTLLEIFYGARPRSPGMPLIESDRWDALLSDFDSPPDSQSPALKLVAAAIADDQRVGIAALATATKAHRTQLAAAAKKLSEITASQQRVVDDTNKARTEAESSHKKLQTDASKAALDAANAKHNTAKNTLNDGGGGAAELKTDVAELRAKIVATIRSASAPEILRSASASIRSDLEFFFANEDAIRDAAEKSSNPNASQALDTALRQLKFVGVEPSKDPTPNDRYHLEQLNTDILSEVLLPQFFNRPPGPNYADPRLTAPKRWRDVYVYGEDGKLAGWTRYQNGNRSDFTADGDLIRSRRPDGTPASVAKVRYAFNPKTKLLEALAAE